MACLPLYATRFTIETSFDPNADGGNNCIRGRKEAGTTVSAIDLFYHRRNTVGTRLYNAIAKYAQEIGLGREFQVCATRTAVTRASMSYPILIVDTSGWSSDQR